MTCSVLIRATYAANPDQLFQSALRFSEMAEAMAGLASYEGFPPEDTASQGDTVTVNVTFLRWIKMPPHTMFIETLDQRNRLIQSRERSDGIERWDHRLSIEASRAGAIWTDSVTIEAGWKTPLVARFAGWMYARRHRRRSAIAVRVDMGGDVIKT